VAIPVIRPIRISISRQAWELGRLLLILLLLLVIERTWPQE
jgi:hypothetical protein